MMPPVECCGPRPSLAHHRRAPSGVSAAPQSAGFSPLQHASPARVLSLLAGACVCFTSITARLLVAEPVDYSAVEAIFTQHCLDCHGSTEPEAKLIMETHELLMKGGEGGAVIVPGKSDESLLVRMIEGRVEKDGKKLIMPPGKKREKLKPEEIALIRAWIDAGAKPPAEFKPKELVVPRIEPKVPPRNPVNAIAYSPARKLVAAARYGEVELRSAETHAVVQALEGHRGNVNAIAFSPDGRFLFAGGGEAGWLGEVRQWDLADDHLFYVFEGHRDAVYSVAVSPDGRTLATGGYDQKIKLWNVATGEEIKTLSGHNGAVFGLAFRPDGKILASASADRTIKLWDVTSGERRDTLSQPVKEQYTVAFSPDGKRLVAGGVDNRIRVWQISETAAETTNPILESRFAHEGTILNLAFSSDGKSLASSADDRTVKIWDAAEWKEKLSLEKQPDWASAVVFVLDNQAVAVGRMDGSLQFYDAANGKVVSAPKPELTRAEPRGIQRGKEVKVRLVGKNLAGVTGVKSHEPKLKAELAGDAGANDAAWIKVAAAGDLARGAYELSVVSGSDESGRIKLYVDDLPQIELTGTNQAESLPSTFWGAHEKPGDSDEIGFAAKAGQTIVFDVAAKSIGSKADTILTLLDASGKVLASNGGFDGSADPLLAYAFESDGEYRVQVSEQMPAGSPEHFYRLSIGGFAYVTGCYPLSIPANAESDLELVGYNLSAERTVRIKAGVPGEMDVPVDLEKFRSRRVFKLIVGDGTELTEVEPNDSPEQATKITAPGAVNGRIWTPKGGSDTDLFRFEAKAGQQWIIETQAAQRGSPVDTKIEVLHADGRPVERMVLQAMRDTAINFRGVDSNNSGMRLDNWEEMELNQFVYLKGDVIRVFRMPQGPDSDMLFYASNGKRRAYFDTTATAHALDEQGYIVEARPPGTKLPASGLPVFHVNYANDDDGERKLGADSRLFFAAPTDGVYLIRVRDSRGYSGDRYVYRLIIREPKPDFKLTLNGANPTVSAGSGREFSVTAERVDGFDGDIRLEITNLPAGFSVSTPLLIQAGHNEAKGTLNAAANATKPDGTNAAASRVIATATISGRIVTREVNNLGRITLGEKPKLYVSFEPDSRIQATTPEPDPPSATPMEITIAPGESARARLKIRRNGYDDLVTFTVEDLPHGVIVDNIGLNGVLIPKGESEREIVLTAAKWVPEQDRLCYAIENQAGRQTSPPVLLRVRQQPAKLAGNGK
ncbi:MAG TPA: c-type cytochrome domain-containing protein [Candidatus Angelobacter sp.]|nr:c-type cytochrome domain-containing protein [Candidatus Angelobacter sp.]